MKRFLMIILAAALLLLCACGGSSISADLKGAEKTDRDDSKAQEAEAPESEADEESRDSERDEAVSAAPEGGETLGEELRTAWLGAVDESGSVPQAPDAAAILSAALAENPGLSAAELEQIVLSALESGEYTMTELPDSDGTDDDHLDALEVMLAQLWIEELSKLDLEPIEIEWRD